MKARYVVGLLLALLAASGCNSLRQVAGMPITPEPSVNIKSAETGWLLGDYGDVVLHIFSPEQRDYYKLEEFWSEGKVILRMQ